jgi:hypothetical protein
LYEGSLKFHSAAACIDPNIGSNYSPQLTTVRVVSIRIKRSDVEAEYNQRAAILI